jgi:hypothetical protein
LTATAGRAIDHSSDRFKGLVKCGKEETKCIVGPYEPLQLSSDFLGSLNAVVIVQKAQFVEYRTVSTNTGFGRLDARGALPCDTIESFLVHLSTLRIRGAAWTNALGLV